jgi:hypothetical protein
VTVSEAAKILDISPEAVRARIKRGTLPKDKDPDGTVYVWLDADQSRWDDDDTDDRTAAQPLIVMRLENEVEFLRRELERKDAIIMNMTETMKALTSGTTAPTEPRDARVSASDRPDRGNKGRDRERKPFWAFWLRD